jgi:hypothetical protein
MAMPLMALVSMIGMTAFVVDVGSWFRADRHMQAVADAAALAGAQALPHNPSKAIDLAEDYAAKNGGPDAEQMVIVKDRKKNDTLRVRYSQDAPGFFARLFGVDTVRVGANASARATEMGAAKWVAPIVVNEKHPMLQCKPKPCFDTPTILDYYNLKSGSDGAGSFGFVDLAGNSSGTSDLKEQIAKGWDQMMPLGQYSARTGNPFSAIDTDLQSRIDTEMLFPIYRSLKTSGTKAEYEIVGWVGFVAFVITDIDFDGSNEKIYGYFTRVVWEGIPADDTSDDDDDDGGGSIDFGAMTVSLTK